ncbi:hypothetical protein GGR57DRAFT_469583 [Xylariaceae sp. FL1272]|nr:hypothetical protein GGR57DRAFT_469583 [Xylariaceae sp. FL1272]
MSKAGNWLLTSFSLVSIARDQQACRPRLPLRLTSLRSETVRLGVDIPARPQIPRGQSYRLAGIERTYEARSTRSRGMTLVCTSFRSFHSSGKLNVQGDSRCLAAGVYCRCCVRARGLTQLSLSCTSSCSDEMDSGLFSRVQEHKNTLRCNLHTWQSAWVCGRILDSGPDRVNSCSPNKQYWHAIPRA